MTPIAMLDLRLQHAPIRAELDRALQRVVDAEQFILGPEVAALEEELAAYCGVRHAVGVSSGTDALLVALMALGVGPGDEVVTTPYTFVATVNCIARLGARARFVDVDETFNLDPGGLERALTAKTKALLPVHLFGQTADVAALRAQTELPIVEDAAQAIGAEHDGVRAGARGELGCLSFFPSKNLGAFGDGGMVLTNDAGLADAVRLLRNQGQRPKYFSVAIGGNFRLDALQAAVLRAKLPHLEGWTAARRANAARYRALFAQANVRASEGTLLPDADVALPLERAGGRHVYNQFVLRCRERDALRAWLAERRIATEVYYPEPMHLQAPFRAWGGGPGDCPNAERAAGESLAIPVHPMLQPADLERVVGAIEAFFDARRVVRRTGE
jgi:dTDP-4-amino-4,6-dideoxygalactose transaminase